MAKLSLFRLVCLSTVLVFSIIVIGLSAHITWLTTEYAGFYLVFAAMSIAVAVLSILSLPAMLIVDSMRKGAFSSSIAFEVGWLGVLWVLFLAGGALAAQAFSVINPYGCNWRYDLDQMFCQETAAVLAFDFLSWIILMAYTITLFAAALKAGGHSWKMSVADYSNNPVAAPSAPAPAYPMAQNGPQQPHATV